MRTLHMYVEIELTMQPADMSCAGHISADASGSGWQVTTIIQDVPQDSKGCGTANDATVFMLVAQLPKYVIP